MMSPSITQNERDGNVTVCAQLNSPAGGTGREIFITLTRSENSQSQLILLKIRCRSAQLHIKI